MEAILTINPITLKKQDSKESQQKNNKFPSLNAESTAQLSRKQPFSNTVKGIRGSGQVNGEEEGKNSGVVIKMKKVKLLPLNAANHTKTSSPKTVISVNSGGNTLFFQNNVPPNQLNNQSNSIASQPSHNSVQTTHTSNNNTNHTQSTNSSSNAKDLQSIFIIHNLNATMAPHNALTAAPSINSQPNIPQTSNLHSTQPGACIQIQQKMFTRNKKSMLKVNNPQAAPNMPQANAGVVQAMSAGIQVNIEENLLETLKSAGGNRKIVSFPVDKTKSASIFTKENNNIENLMKIPSLIQTREAISKTCAKFQQLTSFPIERTAGKSIKSLKKSERVSGHGFFVNNEKKKEINVITSANCCPIQTIGLGSPTLINLNSFSSSNKGLAATSEKNFFLSNLHCQTPVATYTTHPNPSAQGVKIPERSHQINEEDPHERSFSSKNERNSKDPEDPNLIQLIKLLDESDSLAPSFKAGETLIQKNFGNLNEFPQEVTVESKVFYQRNRPSTELNSTRFKKKGHPGIESSAKKENMQNDSGLDVHCLGKKRRSKHKSEFDLKVFMKGASKEDKPSIMDVSGTSQVSNPLLLSIKRAQSNGSGSASIEKTSSSVVEKRVLLLSNGEKSCILKSLSFSTFSDDGMFTKSKSGHFSSSLIGGGCHVLESKVKRSNSSSLFPAIQTITHMDELKALSKQSDQNESCVSVEESNPPIFGCKIRWKILEHLGNGSSCQVYKVMDVESRNIFVVKKMPVDCCDGSDHEFIRSFHEEFNIAHKLNHKNIIKYLGYEVVHQFLYVYLEYMDKGSLSNVLATEGPLPERAVQTYAKQILDGLEYLHNNKIIHKDIKCSNILVSSDGTVKISDFGCSFLIEKTLSTYHFEDKIKKALHGSIPWMAPEVIVQTQFGRNSDIWSFGCTILEMLTSRSPWYQFKFDNPIAAIMKIGLGDDLPLIPENISADLKDILEKCLRRNPHSRITTHQLKAKDYFLK